MLDTATLPVNAATLAPETVAAMLATAGVAVLTFRKRTDGALRTMICTPVDGTQTPTESAVNSAFRVVWDLQKREYRSVPLDSVLSVRTVAIDDLITALQ